MKKGAVAFYEFRRRLYQSWERHRKRPRTQEKKEQYSKSSRFFISCLGEHTTSSTHQSSHERPTAVDFNTLLIRVKKTVSFIMRACPSLALARWKLGIVGQFFDCWRRWGAERERFCQRRPHNAAIREYSRRLILGGFCERYPNASSRVSSRHHSSCIAVVDGLVGTELSNLGDFEVTRFQVNPSLLFSSSTVF